MSEWKTIKLQDCCMSIIDGDHQSMPLSETGIPFIVISDIKANQIDFTNARHVPQSYFDSLDRTRKPQSGDIIYSVKGSFGIPAYVKTDAPFTFQRDIALLKCNNNIDSRYLFHVMRSDLFYRSADLLAIGSAQRALTLKTLRNMRIPFPSISVQRKIADILSAYDTLIENNQKQIKLLEEAAQRLYQEWFVKLRFPGHEKVKIVDGVPEGWKKCLMSEVCDTIGGGTPSTKNPEYYTNGTVRWVTPTDITKNNSLILLDSEKRITEEGLEHSSAKMLPPYTILMTSRASVGFFGLCEHPVCTNQGFISCVPYNENVQLYLLGDLINRVEEIRQKATGSTFLEISKKTFRNMEIIVPDSEVLNQYNATIHPMIKMMEKVAKSIRQLTEARDRLLPKLMSGEIEV